MNINLHIERLVLTNVDVQEHQRCDLKAAVESTLKQQLVSHGIGSIAQSNNYRQSGRRPTVSIAIDHKPTSLGQQIGNAVYRGIRE